MRNKFILPLIIVALAGLGAFLWWQSSVGATEEEKLREQLALLAPAFIVDFDDLEISVLTGSAVVTGVTVLTESGDQISADTVEITGDLSDLADRAAAVGQESRNERDVLPLSGVLISNFRIVSADQEMKIGFNEVTLSGYGTFDGSLDISGIFAEGSTNGETMRLDIDRSRISGVPFHLIDLQAFQKFRDPASITNAQMQMNKIFSAASFSMENLAITLPESATIGVKRLVMESTEISDVELIGRTATKGFASIEAFEISLGSLAQANPQVAIVLPDGNISIDMGASYVWDVDAETVHAYDYFMDFSPLFRLDMDIKFGGYSPENIIAMQEAAALMPLADQQQTPAEMLAGTQAMMAAFANLTLIDFDIVIGDQGIVRAVLQTMATAQGTTPEVLQHALAQQIRSMADTLPDGTRLRDAYIAAAAFLEAPAGVRLSVHPEEPISFIAFAEYANTPLELLEILKVEFEYIP